MAELNPHHFPDEEIIQNLALPVPENDLSLLIHRAHRILAQTKESTDRIIEMIHHRQESAINQAYPVNQIRQDGGASLSDSLGQVITAMQCQFSFKKILLVKIISSKMKPVPVLKEHLDKILFQVIADAIGRLSGQSGILTIEAEEKPYGFAGKSHSVIIKISDSGTSLSQDEARTHEANNPSEIKFDSGVTLLFVKKILDYYGGMLRTQSSPKGNAVYLHFFSH